MTAFARCEADTPWGRLVWELKTVNHRYFEASLRLPDELRAIEVVAREVCAARVGRGKLDATLRFSLSNAPAAVEIDEPQVRRVIEAARRLRVLDPSVTALTAADVLRWPGVLKAPTPEPEAVAEAAIGALKQALDSLVAMRAREGSRLAEFLTARLGAAERAASELRAALPAMADAQRNRLLERVRELKESPDPARLEQELVLMATRTDVTEELDRLASHLVEIRRLLVQGGAIGRRLDFLMQELNREANTLGSKSADLRQTNTSVELKVLIDQMKEQIQNIE